ncbi:UPF0149 family protein [Pseudoxanthomonas daejeonensis]|uniref:YecA family protein n=1 Tax=Pseudoxanthomonas daejeonensis TaxID=266062 RepID=A0ABQ6ZBP4_9GAMM|nr:UPF0149 family protein [Pseudoxanthomonas daejeonensis]KAF1697457.1 YecA family protein [Pseudoxanthomonas daejeonensis]UNK58610.1 UPF0149 family protein [Pseudoxanthomonas daejeonensis]
MAKPPLQLDDTQIERLSALLEQRAVPFRGFNLEALDGFLSALVVAPSPVPPEEWQPVVWGGKAPGWGSPEEAQEVQDLLAGHWNMCAARARHGEQDLPDHLMPLMWLPEDPEDGDEALGEDELDVGREWALGFFEGVALREAEWDQWLEANDWIDELFDLLERLASGEVADADDPEKAPAPLGYRERLEIVMDLPAMLADLNHHHIAALTPRTPIRREAGPGRNDPCPCGSGKKHKKCCGAD